MTNAELHGCAFPGWQCFHCGEVFTTVGGARDHFGADPTKQPGCFIKVAHGDERGLLMELRAVEAERDRLEYQIHNESTAADLLWQSREGERLQALRRAEELGYSRGLQAGMAEARAERTRVPVETGRIRLPKTGPRCWAPYAQPKE